MERVTLATQAWLSNAAPGFSLEIGFISVWLNVFLSGNLSLPLTGLFKKASLGKELRFPCPIWPRGMDPGKSVCFGRNW